MQPLSAKPRQHHYIYAHRWLPGRLWQDPEILYGIASGARFAEFLTFIWNLLGERLPLKQRIAGAKIGGEFRRSGSFGVGIVTLPPPTAVTEAYFTALAFGPLPALQFSMDTRQALPARYFTLEHGFSLPGETPRTVFGEWTTAGAHYNMGTGPAASPDAFFAAISDLLRGQSYGSGTGDGS